MIGSVFNFVKLPYLLIVIWAVMRFSLGVFFGTPYTSPQGSAAFSLVGLTIISCIYYGAISNKVGGFDWKGTLLVGAAIGLFAQVLIFLLSVISWAAGLESSYFIHPSALNLENFDSAKSIFDQVTMGEVVWTRFLGIVFNTITAAVAAAIGRALSRLAPSATAQA